MPRNGSGVYGLPPGTAAVPNTTIESADYNAVNADLAQALTDSVNVNGTAPFQANQPMGNNKLTSLGAGSAATDSANLGQAQSDIVAHAASVGGTADAITATFSPVFTAYTAKMRFRFTAAGANTLTNPTVNVDGLGVKTIKKLNGVALEVADIVGSGHVCDCVYNGTDVLLLNPGFWPGRANTFAADIDQTFAGRLLGTLETLTDGATIAWDMAARPNDVKILLSASRALGAASNLVENQRGRMVIMQDGTGGWSLTPNAAYKQPGGQTVLDIDTAANARTVYEYHVVKNSGGTNEVWLKRLWSEGKTSLGFYKEYNVGTLVTNQTRTQAHGLGRYPAFVQCWLQLTTAEFGYLTTDRLDLISLADSDTSDRQPSVIIDATNIRFRIGSSNNALFQRLDANSTVGINSLATPPNIFVRVYE